MSTRRPLGPAPRNKLAAPTPGRGYDRLLYSPPMRRWLTVLLLVLLPLQFVWAAAAPYCQHEESAEARHIGHHEHEHQSAADAQKATKSSDSLDDKAFAKWTVDDDCAYCHLSATQSPLSQLTELVPLAGAARQEAGAYPFGTRAPDHHERPNWCIA